MSYSKYSVLLTDRQIRLLRSVLDDSWSVASSDGRRRLAAIDKELAVAITEYRRAKAKGAA